MSKVPLYSKVNLTRPPNQMELPSHGPAWDTGVSNSLILPPLVDCQTILKLTSWVCGASSSTWQRKRALDHQLGQPEWTKAVLGNDEGLKGDVPSCSELKSKP